MPQRVNPRPLGYKKLLRRLEPYGVMEVPYRGKGSERMLVRPDPATGQGPRYFIACHGEHTMIGVRTIRAILRRFAIDADQFWSE